MTTFEFACDRCSYYNAEFPVSGWIDGAGYVIITCPKCKNEHVSLEQSECD